MANEVKKGSVEEKCLERLYPRKLALDWWPEVFMDKGCVKLFEDYAYKPAKYADKISKMDAARLLIAEYNTVEVAKKYLRDHPRAIFVNLACGFSTVFQQIDNGQCRAYNVDTRYVLIARKEAVGKGDREQGIIADILEDDFSWFEKIEWTRDDGIFFYALDLFHYMKREDVKRIVANIAVNFPDGMMVFDAASREGLPKILKTRYDEDEVKNNAGFYFSVDDDAQITKWSVRIAEIWRHPLYTYYTKKKANKLGLINLMAVKALDSKNEVQFVELTFKRH
jgi:O-methyltransferase involved in polyketide biosynthesis